MKSLTSTLFLLLLTLLTYAKDNLERYYQEINNAELAIIDNDLNRALNHYHTAFSNKEEPFAIDYCNAAVCALKSGDTDQGYVYCRCLAEKGVGPAFFEKKSIFHSLKLQKEKWNTLIQKAAASAGAWDKKTRPLKQRLKGLYDRDQEMHAIWARSGHNNELELELKKVDDSIANELYHIFKQKGFLSELNMGVFMENDTTIAGQPGFYVIMLHNFQGRVHSDTIFAPMLRQAVHEGLLRPIILAWMFDGNYHQNLEAFATNNYLIFRCVLYSLHTFTPSGLEDIEENRRRIYLPSMSDFRTKLLYNINDPQNDFTIVARQNRIGSFADEASEKKFLKNTKAIQKLDNCD